MSSDNSIYCYGKKDKHGLGQGDATIDGNVGDVIPLSPSRTIKLASIRFAFQHLYYGQTSACILTLSYIILNQIIHCLRNAVL